MMKYKVGDKVRIRKDLTVDGNYGNVADVVPEMLRHAGKAAFIIVACGYDDTYKINIDAQHWWWSDEMFENVDTEVQEMHKHVVIDVDGNKVVASCGDKKGVARCHPDDDFDFYVGAKLALERLEEAEKPYAWLKMGMKYYTSDVTASDLYGPQTYSADKWDNRYMKRGIVFRTKEEAIACAKKMLAAVKQEG